MLISLKKISKSYFNSYGKRERMVLQALDLNIEKGEKIAITGPSGSGKSTLLNIAGGLDLPDEGETVFDNRPLNTLNKNELAEFRNKMIGFVFQSHHLLPQCTLFENILIPTLPLKDKRYVYKRAEELMKKTGIWDMREQKPGELSGGECQRAAVVRSLINNPLLILADEPTGALDEENASGVISILEDFNKTNNITLAVVTHSNEIAGKMDKRYRLKNGKLELL